MAMDSFGGVKPAQNEKQNKQKHLKPTNAKPTTQNNKSKNVKTVVQNATCQLHQGSSCENQGSYEFMDAHCSWVFMCVFCFFGGRRPLAYPVGFHAPKKKYLDSRTDLKGC